MKLNEKWSIEKEGTGIALLEKVEIKKKDGSKGEAFRKSYYGSVYQALQSFIQKSGECGHTPSEVGMKAIEAYNTIEELKEKIRREFRTEIKVVK